MLLLFAVRSSYFGDFDFETGNFYGLMFVEINFDDNYPSNCFFNFIVYSKLSFLFKPIKPLVTLPNFFNLLLFFLSEDVALDKVL